MDRKRLQVLSDQLPDGDFYCADVCGVLGLSEKSLAYALRELQHLGRVKLMGYRGNRKVWRRALPKGAVLTPAPYRVNYAGWGQWR